MKKHLLFAGCSVFLGGVLFFSGYSIAAGPGGGGKGGGNGGGHGGGQGGGHGGGQGGGRSGGSPNGNGRGNEGRGNEGRGNEGRGNEGRGGGPQKGGGHVEGNFGGGRMQNSDGKQQGPRNFGNVQAPPQRNPLPGVGTQFKHQHSHQDNGRNNPGVKVQRPNLNQGILGSGLQQNHLPGMHHNDNPSPKHLHNGIQVGPNSFRIGGNHYHPSYQNYSWHHGHWHNYGEVALGLVWAMGMELVTVMDLAILWDGVTAVGA
ncbi:MAG: hypothetical protein U0894_07960 [Pirellulales bacterium]